MVEMFLIIQYFTLWVWHEQRVLKYTCPFWFSFEASQVETLKALTTLSLVANPHTSDNSNNQSYPFLYSLQYLESEENKRNFSYE